MPFGIPSEDFRGGFGLPRDDDYDPYTGKYAFCSPSNEDLGFGENWVSESPEMSDEDRELAEAAQETHDNLVRSLIEAGGEIREARELLNEAKDALLYMLILHKAQDPRYNQEKIIPALYMLQSEPDKWTPERADEVFKKIFDYLEQEEDDGT